MKEQRNNWLKENLPIIPIVVALILLAIALVFQKQEFANLASYAVVALTAVYVYANMRMVQEMKQTRIDAAKPSLTLQPARNSLGGTFFHLYVRNSGGLAKDIRIDIEIDNPKENHGCLFLQ